MKSKIVDIVVFALLFSLIGFLGIKWVDSLEEAQDLNYEIQSLKKKAKSDSVLIRQLEKKVDTVEVSTTAIIMGKKRLSIDDYITLFNRLYSQNESRADSVRYYKELSEMYQNNFNRLEKIIREHNSKVHTSEQDTTQ